MQLLSLLVMLLYDKFGRLDDRFRHDKALEDLQKANMEWNEKEPPHWIGSMKS
jgi:hypothetical protein